MAPYTAEQLALYFDRIRYPASQHASDPLDFLTSLTQLQLVSVPFETLSLHYSTDRTTVSLDPQNLFENVVSRSRGGYCLELNTFYAAILRSLGFQVSSVICRMTQRSANDGSWRAMSHMANIVALGSRRYLLDVGCGVDGPSQPLPLLSGEICDGLPRQQLRLEHKVLPQHSDPGQRVWVYAQRRDLGAWDEVYHFADVEFFPLDFEILNHYTVTKSYWAQVVVAQRFDFDDAKRISSLLFLFGDELKTGAGPSANMKLEEKVKTEQDRVAVLEEYFGVRLAEDERNAIRGHISEIIDIPPAGSA